MRKADYLTLAQTLRAGVYQWSIGESPILGETVQEYAIRQSLHCQAVNMARYLHQHLQMPKDIKDQFLELCGVRPVP